MKSKYVSNLAFIDLLFNLILGFIFLFLIAFMLINKPTETGKVDPKAEFMIVMYWQDQHIGDIDLWVDTPDGLVNYISPNIGSTHLDKDDLGIRNDWYTDSSGTRQYVYINREIVTLRSFVPGEYIVNAHYYGSTSPKEYGTGIIEGGPAQVTVEVIQLNPFYIISTKQHILESVGMEKTFIRFSMNSQGRVSNINYLPKQMVQKIVASQGGH
jgi:hypothetical protein